MNTVLRSLSLSAVAVIFSANAFASPSDDANLPAIRSVLQQYEQALNKGDVAAITQLYTTDGVQMAPDAPAAVGREAVRAAYDGTFKAISLNLKFTIDELKSFGPDAAVLRTHSNGTLKVVGKADAAGPASYKELFVLRKQGDGQWKFSHYSFSGSVRK